VIYNLIMKYFIAVIVVFVVFFSFAYETNSGTLSFADLYNNYVGKINPKTGLSWTIPDIAANAGVSEGLIQGYIDWAQNINYYHVIKNYPPYTNQQIIALWDQSPGAYHLECIYQSCASVAGGGANQQGCVAVDDVCGGGTLPPAPSDNQTPTIPQNLVANVISQSQISLSWSASTDNVGVVGYKVFRDNVQKATVSKTAYQATGLLANTSYVFSVAAYDAVGNTSGKSTSVTAKTTNATTKITTTPGPSQWKQREQQYRLNWSRWGYR
jgi:hypothetical protein